jgi:hypothetical protein
MKTTMKLLSILVVLIAFTSCKKESSDAKAKLEIVEKPASATANKSANAIGTLTITKALVGVSKVDFETQAQNGDFQADQEYKYEGAFTFNLLTGESTPSIPAVTIDPGTYHELEVEIDDVMPSGNAIEVSGTYEVGGVTFQFEFTTKQDLTFEIENSQGVPVSQGDYVTFLLELDLRTLFSSIDFASATVGQNGIIRINANSNEALHSFINDRLDDMMDFD